MRHLGSVLLSLLLTPVIWVLIGAGIDRYQPGETALASGELGTVFGLLALLAAGGLYALLVLIRISPAGPGLAGLLYLGVSLWAGAAPEEFHAAMPDSALGASGAVEDPATQFGLVLAIPLIATMFSGRRWRGYDHLKPSGSRLVWPPRPTDGADPGTGRPGPNGAPPWPPPGPPAAATRSPGRWETPAAPRAFSEDEEPTQAL